ncbi:hypothetical protein [Streptomyces sp. CB03238]|uniref:hypothetical protein n=1 Tax=Streptomyces sp. CB03238 TaxID=1907777 RepID=UPI000A1186F5|nr:hypothetical protein [Streptomyces sp. CB03238]ORT55056.1 hypothetical protein BKD26_33575 [Streptomyces sp. CB03238]
MPLIPEEPQIHESAQGPRATPAAGRPASTPRPVPGPRSAASPRPGRPGPGPARPTPPVSPRQHTSATQPPTPRPENRSVPRSSSPTQPQVQMIPAPTDGALDAAEEAVDLLLETGRTPGDILVLTTGEQHPWATHELSFGDASYWAQHDARDDVFFADAAAVERASARPVVVVAVNGGGDDAAARALPAALARASALLIVCGDPQRINSVLGAGV